MKRILFFIMAAVLSVGAWAADDLTLNASETVTFGEWGFDNSGAPTLVFGNWAAGGGWQFETALSQDDYCGVDIAFEATTETHVTFFIDYEGGAEQSIDVPTGSTGIKADFAYAGGITKIGFKYGDWVEETKKDAASITITSAVVKANTGEAGGISLSVSDMQFDWGGSGGSANATENSITVFNYTNNYWTVDNLSTDEYTGLKMVFAQPANFYRVYVRACYSDDTKTETEMTYGATSLNLNFTPGKTLVKIEFNVNDWDSQNPEGTTFKFYFTSITIVGSGGSVEPTTYEDVTLSVADLQLPEWGATKDADEKSCTFGGIWDENYWTVGNLSTDVYTRVDLTFAQPVNYYKVRVKAVYSDNSETDTEITYGAESHSVKLTAGKRLVKLAMKQYDQKNLNGGATVKLYFDDIIIRTEESAAAVTPKTWTSSFKLGTNRANPLLDFHFIADPTAIEYNGRLYVYGTNDHQQYEAGTPTNSYEAIQSLVVISTDDMVNWTYHGTIDVKSVAPWIMASWAPTIIKKEQADGTTLFSLYFSNSGTGSGVIQATSPLGPWTSPLDENLTGGFDPGAVIDDNGAGWLAYGTGESYIVKLGDDLHSIAAGPVKLNAPYYFEANELNYIGGKYVHTYNNDWTSHEPWNYGGTKPTGCSMNYFTTTTPLDADSWTYGANYFKNTGDNGMNYGNNHTHLHKYQDKWYLFYQSNDLEPSLGTNGGFRSLFVDEIEVDEEKVVISECTPTFTGVSAIKNFDPYTEQYAATCAATLGIVFEQAEGNGHTVAKVGSPNMTADTPTEGIIEVRNVAFADGIKALKCLVKGTGSVTLRIDGADIATVSSTGSSWQILHSSLFTLNSGTKTIQFVLTGSVQFDTWQILTSPTVSISTEADYATFGYADAALDLTDVDAYTVTVNGDKAQLNSIQGKKIPAGTGIIVKGSGDVTIPLTFDSTDEVGDNALLVSDGTVAADLSTIYVLANGTNGVGFYLLKNGYVHKGKAYLRVPASASVRQFIGFGDNATTGISQIENGELNTEDAVFNLNGQHVAQPTKGLYVVNGKKVVITK